MTILSAQFITTHKSYPKMLRVTLDKTHNRNALHNSQKMRFQTVNKTVKTNPSSTPANPIDKRPAPAPSVLVTGGGPVPSVPSGGRGAVMLGVSSPPFGTVGAGKVKGFSSSWSSSPPPPPPPRVENGWSEDDGGGDDDDGGAVKAGSSSSSSLVMTGGGLDMETKMSQIVLKSWSAVVWGVVK